MHTYTDYNMRVNIERGMALNREGSNWFIRTDLSFFCFEGLIGGMCKQIDI